MLSSHVAIALLCFPPHVTSHTQDITSLMGTRGGSSTIVQANLGISCLLDGSDTSHKCDETVAVIARLYHNHKCQEASQKSHCILGVSPHESDKHTRMANFF